MSTPLLRISDADGIRPVWRTPEVAAFWQRTPTTIRRWVEAGTHPQPRTDPSGQHYWLPEEVLAFDGHDLDDTGRSPAGGSGGRPADPVEPAPLELVIGSRRSS